jgi:hypothetical protein
MAINNTPSLIHVAKKNKTDFKAILRDPEMAVLNDTAKTVRTFISNVSRLVVQLPYFG